MTHSATTEFDKRAIRKSTTRSIGRDAIYRNRARVIVLTAYNAFAYPWCRFVESVRPICLCSTRQKKHIIYLAERSIFLFVFLVGASLRIRFCWFDVIVVCSIVRSCFVYILFPIPRCASDIAGLLWTTTTTTNDGVGGRMQATMYVPPATRQHSRCTCVSVFTCNAKHTESTAKGVSKGMEKLKLGRMHAHTHNKLDTAVENLSCADMCRVIYSIDVWVRMRQTNVGRIQILCAQQFCCREIGLVIAFLDLIYVHAPAAHSSRCRFKWSRLRMSQAICVPNVLYRSAVPHCRMRRAYGWMEMKQNGTKYKVNDDCMKKHKWSLRDSSRSFSQKWMCDLMVLNGNAKERRATS